MTAAQRPEKRLLGVAMVLAATAIFSLSDVVSKFLLADVNPYQASWLRSAFVLLFTLPAVFLRLGPAVAATAHPGVQLFRGLTVLGSSIFFLIGLSQMSLGDVVAINFIWPIMITALSVPLLGERVGVRRWSAAAVGFAGMLLIVKPGATSFQTAAIYPLAGAALWALSNVVTRRMSATERPETTLVWSAVIAFIAMSLAMPFVWQPLTWREIGMGALIGLGSSMAHALYVFALDRARASTLAPFSYMQLVWSMLLGVLVFGDRPEQWTLVGAALIVLSGLYTAHRERVRAGD